MNLAAVGFLEDGFGLWSTEGCRVVMYRVGDHYEVDIITSGGALGFDVAASAVKTELSSDDCLPWGRCPECRELPKTVNVGKVNFAVCDDCKVYWLLGSGLITPAPDEWTDEHRERCLATYSAYREVESYHGVKVPT